MKRNIDFRCLPIDEDGYRDVENIDFEDYITRDLKITYPLGKPFTTTITFTDLYTLIDNIREAYKEVYENPKLYKVWGHSIDDLVLEEIRIGSKNIHLSIGS